MDFSFIDFIIGLTLVNTLPHFVLGLWKGRMISGLGFGNDRNILYGILNFLISISLLIYQYGADGLLHNGIYLGAMFVIISYFIVGKYCYRIFHQDFYSEKEK